MLYQVILVEAWVMNVLFGLARAVSDWKFRAYLEDVVIHKDYKRSRIGSQLVVKLLKKLSHIDLNSLFCEEELIPFYERNDLNSSKSQFVRHRKQS